MTRRAAHQERTRNSTARRYLTGLLAALTAATLGAARAPSHLAENPPVTANRTIPRVEAPQPWRGFSTAPADAEITAVRAFPEPLVPIGTTTPDDNRAVAAAVSALLKSADRMNPVPLTEFVAEYPSSPWRASVLANLGAMYRRQGYITRALEAWDAAWELAKDAPTARGRAIANFAIGEALDFAVELGQRSLIEPRIMAIGTRTIPGAAGGKVDLARFALARADQDPQSSVPSGQGAVRALLEDRGIRLMPASFRRAEQRREMLTLPRMRRLARDAGLATILARRGTGSLIVPSIVHLRMNYVTTLLQYDAGRGAYLVRDPAFGGERWIAEGVLSDEMSGLALLPGDRLPAGWVAVSEAEAQTSGGGAWCPVASPDPTAPPCDPECCTPPCNGPGGMPRYSLNVINAGLLITDLPVAYVPVRGPSVDLTLRYHSRDVLQPQIFAYGNVGYRWEHSWVSFIEEVPEVAGPSGGYHPEYVDVHLRGGGSESLLGPPAAGGSYGTFWRSRSTLVRVSQTPIRYERRLPDGSLEVYAQPDNAPAGQWRRVFLTDVVDPQGHTLHLTYDAQLRLAAITDATGLVTTLAYEWGPDPLKLTRVTDPFGRSAGLTYTTEGLLASITDAIGMTSTFTYEQGDFIAAMTTPYGTTTFRKEGDPNNAQVNPIIEATDPLGGTEHLEYRWENGGVPASEPPELVPEGFAAANVDLDKYNTVYWNQAAWAAGPGDLSKATITNWLWYEFPTSGVERATPVAHSVKRPLENRVWYAYPGQPDPRRVGTHRTPSVTARVLDDGTTQKTLATYNAQGQVLTRTDPLGRQTTSSYAANGIDLLEVRNTSPGVNELLTSYGSHNAQHLPGTVTDAAGQTTTYTYDSAGRVLTVTTPPRAGVTENRTTTYAYDTEGRLQTVTGPATGATTTYTYDGFGRVRTVTDPDGYTITTDYDALNRPTRVTYPDGTYEETTYERLDAVARRDRLGRLTRMSYDAAGRLVATRDPEGRLIVQDWCACGSLNALIDANGNKTRWERDAAGRVIREIRADNTTITHYTYDSLGRLKTVTDPKQQVTTQTYNLDNTLASTVYTNAQIATPSVSFTYDPAYNRVATMVDGTGTTTYIYHPSGVLGAGQVASVDGPLPDDTITYQYDELGRVVTRAINGVAATQQYDSLGRVTSETNVLGTFTYGYEGVTGRLASVQYPNGQTSAYSYLPNAQDHRLQTIHHRYPNTATLSKFDYTYDAVGNILTWRQQADSTAVIWEYGYDRADQLTAAIKRATDPQGTILKRYYYRYDPAGNRLSEQIDDAVTSWTYDNLNRLVTQTPGGWLKVRGQLDEYANVTINGKPASVSSANAFDGSAQVGAGTTAFTITAADVTGNPSSRAFEVDTAGMPRAFTFDANGNLTSDGTRTFEWDAGDRLLSIAGSSDRFEFQYDGLGRRSRLIKKTGGMTISDVFLIWCDLQLCEERSSGGTVRRRRLPRAEQVDGSAQFWTTDHLGSIRAVSTSDQVLATYETDAFGRPLALYEDNTRLTRPSKAKQVLFG